MKMLGKDRNYFKKNQARKNKNDEAAASNMADAEAGSDLEDDADDDDDEPEQTAPEPTKAVATKKRAPKKHATNLKKLAAPTPALPTIQNGCLNGTVIVKKETALGSRRPHRKKNWHYESAPSESEWEQKKHDKSDPYKNENIAKLGDRQPPRSLVPVRPDQQEASSRAQENQVPRGPSDSRIPGI
jgi:hypothetical protein